MTENDLLESIACGKPGTAEIVLNLVRKCAEDRDRYKEENRQLEEENQWLKKRNHWLTEHDTKPILIKALTNLVAMSDVKYTMPWLYPEPKALTEAKVVLELTKRSEPLQGEQS